MKKFSPGVVFIVLAIAAIALFEQNCAGPAATAQVVAPPLNGLKSPFENSKLLLTSKFLKNLPAPTTTGGRSGKTAAAQASGNISQNPQIPAGSPLVFILNDTCMQTRYAEPSPKPQYFIDKYLTAAYYQQPLAKFDDSAVSILLKSPIFYADLMRIAQTDFCIVGITNATSYQVQGSSAQSSPISYNDPGYPAQQPYLNQINFSQGDAFFAANVPSSVKVNVAVIDTGFDFQNADIGPISALLQGSDIAGNTNIPPDTDGHGTGVASLITAVGNNGKGIVGIANRNVNLIPIRLLTNNLQSPCEKTNSNLPASSVFDAVKLSVNAGAEVINMSFTTNTLASGASDDNCDILTGFAMYRAIAGGAFFSIAAGQWTATQTAGGNCTATPGLITPPLENGPLPLGPNSGPACWGRYFKGAVTVGGLATGSQTLASFSNWGATGVELSAPATNLETYGLQNQLTQVSGTSFSAAQVTAAAALAIAFHKQQGWPYSPWLIEDILLNGSASATALQSPPDGRSVHNGKMLDLGALTAHLTQLMSETPLQRLQEPSENPETGLIIQNGSGGPAPALLTNIQTYSDNPILQSTGANKTQIQVVAYFSNASMEVVSGDPLTTYSLSDNALATIDASGMLYPKQGALGTEVITASYLGKQSTTSVTLVSFSVLTGESANLIGIQILGQGPNHSFLPLPDASLLKNMCPMPHQPILGSFHLFELPYAYDDAAGKVELNQNMNAGIDPLHAAGELSPFHVIANYSDGSSRDLGPTFGLGATSASLTKADGTVLDNDDMGNSTVLISVLYRGQQTSLSWTHGTLQVLSAKLTPSAISINRGNNLFVANSQVTTSGSCEVFAKDDWGNFLVDPATGKIKLDTIVNPVFTPNSSGFLTAASSTTLSSPQPVLNGLLQTQPLVDLVKGLSPPAGTYTINTTFTYRTSGSVQTLNLNPIQLTLNDLTPVGADILGTFPHWNGVGTGNNAPANSIQGAVKFSDGKDYYDARFSFNWIVKDANGNEITAGATNPAAPIWYDVQTLGAVNGTIAINDFTGNLGDTVSITAKELTTGVSTSKTLSVGTTIVNSYSGQYVNSPLPNLKNPTPLPTPAAPNSYCTAQNQASVPFAGGSGTQGDPFTICATKQFFAMAAYTQPINQQIVTYFQLKQNLDFASLGNVSTLMSALPKAGNVAFDGGGFEISNLTSVDTEALNNSVFPISSSLTITNLIINSPVLAGGAVGTINGALGGPVHLQNVYVINGNLSGVGTGGSTVGGFLGNMRSTAVTIDKCFVLSTQISSVMSSGVGGFVGLSGLGNLTITNSGANVTINNVGVPGSMSNVGGLVGQFQGFGSLTFVSDYSAGWIHGGSNSVGGLVGGLSNVSGTSLIARSASSMEVVAQGTDVGGLLGQAVAPLCREGIGIVYGSVSSGKIWGGQSSTGGSNVGGLIGSSRCLLVQSSTASGAVSGTSTVGGFIGVDDGYNQIVNSGAQGAVSASSGTAVGGFGGTRTQFRGHNLDLGLSGNTWTKASSPSLLGYGNYLNKGSFTPNGLVGN